MEFFQFCFDRARITPTPRNWNRINRGENSFHNAIHARILRDMTLVRLISFKRVVNEINTIPYNKLSRQRIAILFKWKKPRLNEYT